MSDMAGQHGKVCFAANAMQKQFPHAARLLGPDRLAALGCSSYIVGMIVPGLHSLFVGFKVRVVAATGRDELGFEVESVDPRIRQVIFGDQRRWSVRLPRDLQSPSASGAALHSRHCVFGIEP